MMFWQPMPRRAATLASGCPVWESYEGQHARMNLIWHDALWFIVAVGLLVTVHEFGHYWVARRLGFKVLRFSVGCGKPLLSRVAGADRTEYVVAAIPLGGYVKLLDEREGPVAAHDLGRSFTHRPPWQRIAVLLAGPAFNIVFAILVLWGIFWVSGITQVKPLVGDVVQNSVAARGGLRTGDEILGIDGNVVSDQRDVVFDLLDAVSSHGVVHLSVRGRDGVTRASTLTIADKGERVHLTEPSALFEGLGFQFLIPTLPPVLGEVTSGGPAGRAGLRAGDRIVSINGEAVSDFKDIQQHVTAHPDDSLAITYRRGDTQSSVRVAVAGEVVDGKRIGRIRVKPVPDGMLAHTALTPMGALSRATQEAWSLTALQG